MASKRNQTRKTKSTNKKRTNKTKRPGKKVKSEQEKKEEEQLQEAKMRPAGKLPTPRLFIYPEDIVRIMGCTLSSAKSKYYNMRRSLRKEKGGEISAKELAKYTQQPLEEIMPYMHMPLVLRLLIVSLLLLSFTKQAANHIPRLQKYFDDHHVFWLESRNGYQRGEMEVKDPKTGKVEIMTIEVEERR